MTNKVSSWSEWNSFFPKGIQLAKMETDKALKKKIVSSIQDVYY